MFKKILLAAAMAGAALGAQAQTNLLTNGSFEATSNNAGSYCYLGGACTLQDWTGTAPVIATNSGAWGNPSGLANWNAAFGAQLVGLQTTTTVGQDITLGAGTYTLSWFDAGRSGYASQNYDVVIAGNIVAQASTVGGQGWAQHSVTFTTTGGDDISFVGHQAAADGTAFIDQVSLTAVPEPTSTALMMVGTLALLARRRRVGR